MSEQVVSAVPRRSGWDFLKLGLVGFALGVAAAIVFQQAALAALNALGLDGPPTLFWSLSAEPGPAAILTASLLGGLLGALLVPLLARLRGALYWIIALVAGAVIPSLAYWVVAFVLRGEVPAIPDDTARIAILLVANAAWGLGVAVIFQLARTTPSIVRSA